MHFQSALATLEVHLEKYAAVNLLLDGQFSVSLKASDYGQSSVCLSKGNGADVKGLYGGKLKSSCLDYLNILKRRLFQQGDCFLSDEDFSTILSEHKRQMLLGTPKDVIFQCVSDLKLVRAWLDKPGKNHDAFEVLALFLLPGDSEHFAVTSKVPCKWFF